MSQTKAQLIDNLVSPITGALGSASAPTFSFTADPNTGLYSPGADQVAISTNGTGRLFVDASGNVGIGATPNSYAGYSTLTINNTSGSELDFEVNGTLTSDIYTDSTGTYWTTRTAVPIALRTNSVERLRVTSAGLVGIGTSAPGGLLELSSNASGTLAGEVLLQRIRSNSVGNTSFVDVKSRRHTAGSNWTGLGFRLQHQVDETPMGFLEFNSLVSGQDVAIGTGGSTRLLVNSSGNVGIGTTSPLTALHVQSAAGTDQIRWTDNTNGSGLLDTAAGASRMYSNVALAFGTGSATFSEKARIDTSGRLLVGTSSSTSVGAKLQVRDDTSGVPAEFLKSSDDAFGPAIYLSKSRGTVGTPAELSNGDTLGYLFFRGYDGAAWQNAASITAIADGTWTDGGDTTDNPSALVFSTTADGASSPTERMRINSSGQILAGANIQTTGQVILNNGSPTIYLQDTDHNSSALYCNGNTFYVFRGGNNTTSMTSVDGVWPLEINLTNNDAAFGRTITSQAYQNIVHFVANWRNDGVTALASSFNYIMQGVNDTGNKLSMFLNSSTRTTDGGANALTFRNDGGPLNLGKDSYQTNILGSTLYLRNNPAISNGSYAVGNNHIELRTDNGSNPTLGFHRSGFTAVALYHDTGNSLRLKDAAGTDSLMLHTTNYNSYAPTLTG